MTDVSVTLRPPCLYPFKEWKVEATTAMGSSLHKIESRVQKGAAMIAHVLSGLLASSYPIQRAFLQHTAAKEFLINKRKMFLTFRLLSAIFSRTGALLTMVINYVQVSSAMSKLKATRRDLTILLLCVFSKVYMTHHCNSGVLSCKSGV